MHPATLSFFIIYRLVTVPFAFAAFFLRAVRCEHRDDPTTADVVDITNVRRFPRKPRNHAPGQVVELPAERGAGGGADHQAMGHPTSHDGDMGRAK